MGIRLKGRQVAYSSEETKNTALDTATKVRSTFLAANVPNYSSVRALRRPKSHISKQLLSKVLVEAERDGENKLGINGDMRLDERPTT